MKTKLRICSIAELRPGEAKRVEANPSVAVFNIAGDFFAVADLCTHAKASMSEGYIDEDACTVECPLHGAIFSLKDGSAMTQPANVPLKTFPVSVHDQDVFVEVEAN